MIRRLFKKRNPVSRWLILFHWRFKLRGPVDSSDRSKSYTTTVRTATADRSARALRVIFPVRPRFHHSSLRQWSVRGRSLKALWITKLMGTFLNLAFSVFSVAYSGEEAKCLQSFAGGFCYTQHQRENHMDRINITNIWNSENSGECKMWYDTF